MENRAPTGACTYSSAVGEAENYMRWVLEAFDSLIGRRVLEVGIGHGSYVRHLNRLESYLGVDIDPDSVAEARRIRPRDEYMQADVVDPVFIPVLAGYHFDTVLCFNVLEHIKDHRAAVANMLSVLRPGGRLLVLVPAFQSLYSSLDRFAGHHRRYTRAQLADLVPGDLGTIVRNEYFNPVGGLGWWANKFMAHRSLNDASVNGQVRLFDRYLLPVSRVVNPVTRNIFGQSVLLAVCRS